MTAPLCASPSDIMRQFDELPAIIRTAMCLADFPYDPYWVARRIERGHKPERIAALINLSTERKIHVG
ncbi:hypothetical protein [Rhizobium sp. BK602]|uniref:hypothetical protein n=1 Tax=Rhizobium sp. BK602 TaxID=2586986 RepID=UPI00161428CA|nr:hypothetical protein [Rhizobium sp. BK602]MBB3608645.1 hypothetical protein [Rhizobium sp. BK602]